MGFYQWLQLVNNFHDLNDILAISWQFLAGFVLYFFGCSFVFFAISWDIQGKFCLFFQFTGQSYCINNHIPSSLISPIYSKCQFRHFACLFNPASEASGVVLNLTGDLSVTFVPKMVENDHFWSLGDHRWKSSFWVPDQSSGVQNVPLGRAKKMGERRSKKNHF